MLPRVLVCVLLAWSISGCCNGRDTPGTGILVVDPEEPCPGTAQATAEFEKLGGWGGEEFVSVDGPAERSDGLSQAECCYGVSLINPTEQLRLCPGVWSSDPLPPACPLSAEAEALVKQEMESQLLDQQRFGSIDSGPVVERAFPRTDSCRYPVTMHTSADSCG